MRLADPGKARSFLSESGGAEKVELRSVWDVRRGKHLPGGR